MVMGMSSHCAANVERFSGFADCYDAYRPAPPAALVDVLTQLAGVARAGLVVDVGSGTGLSTRIWAGRAESVIGVEPNADMRRQAEMRTAAMPDAQAISYREGTSTKTGLPDGCADIVTCCQCLHWMEPEPTFAEIARVLRPGGVFAACDYDWPPTMHWELEAAYQEVEEVRVETLERQHGFSREVRRWAKGEHLGRMKKSGRFRYVKEILLHQMEMGDAQRLVGLALSQGSVETLLKNGLSEEEIGITELRATAERILGGRAIPWCFSSRVRVGIR